ncbi:histidinol-phosphate transaminase [Paenibacillus hodogayensis]|uniref:Histidinol-phosphate aminotransferase n=1 Tax=Paenibacillus hodogayensis TaxID=279208 RepID=A0ABV5VZC8_9BACL
MVQIHPRIERLQPYAAGTRPDPGIAAIKLNQNESPYPVSPKVEQAIRSSGAELLREYPDSGCGRLRAALSELHGVPAGAILCGNGSSELITLLYKSFLCENDTVAVPDPTFGLYATAAALVGVKIVSVPTDDDFRLEPGKLAEPSPQAIIIANPNAPTGLYVEAEQIERLLNDFRGLVVVDEAYIDFVPEGTSVIGLTKRYSNLIVLRTFSKAYGLSGARIGYAVADERLIAAMAKGRETFSVNAVAQLAAEAALTDPAYTSLTVERINRTHEAFRAALTDTGWRAWPSFTNFLLATPPSDGPTAQEIYQRLLDRHIYVRYFDAPRLSDKLRISIGTDTEMKTLLEALSDAGA